MAILTIPCPVKKSVETIMYQGLLHTLFSGSFCVTDCTPTKNNQAGPRAGEELPFVFP